MVLLKGRVDEYGRALIPIEIRNPDTGASLTVTAWIDTGFTDYLYLRTEQAKQLDLQQYGESIVTVADGSQASLPSCDCEVEWFAKKLKVRALTAPNRFALVGVHLLENIILKINFDTGEVELTPTENFWKA